MRGKLVLALVPLLLAAACSGRSGASSGGRLRVVTTVAPITSIVGTIAGAHAEVVGVVPEGVDSHTFEPAPSVAAKLARADIVFVNGLGLEQPTEALLRADRGGARLVRLGDRVTTADELLYDRSFPRNLGRPNPHLWTDPGYARRYADAVVAVLAEEDPARRVAYQRNHARFLAEVQRLDVAMRAALATVPPERRKLLTYHDAYAYFARSYGWELIGAVQVADFREPSARELAALIRQVREAGVPAIFGSEVFPSRILEQIGREAGVAYVDDLRDDDLPGAPGDAEHSWLGLMRVNYVTITRAMGGDPAPLEALQFDALALDRARYPQ